MSLYPCNTNVARTAQTDTHALKTNLLSMVQYSPGSLTASDDDRFVVSVDMKVGAYALAATTMPEAATARKLLITVTADTGNDTMGTLAIVGTNINGAALSETIAPTAAGTATTLNAFKTVSSITGAGWIIGGGAGTEDAIKIGTADAVGLPDCLTDTAQVLLASVNNVKDAGLTVTVSATVLSLNTVDTTSVLAGTPFKVYYAL
jgi:hypothetical protein